MTASVAFEGYRIERDLLWPNYDQKCAAVTFDEMDRTMDAVLAHVPAQRVVVQAGGNCGVWVRRFAQVFGAVYTFEPDHRNFVALTANTAASRNVYRFQAGLSDRAAMRGMADGDGSQNCGAGYLVEGGAIPTLTIDTLDLPACDLIYLDIEGSELRAVRGAGRTIGKYRPIVAFEDKGLGARFYGEARGGTEEWLVANHGYCRLEKRGNDFVMGPA